MNNKENAKQFARKMETFRGLKTAQKNLKEEFREMGVREEHITLLDSDDAESWDEFEQKVCQEHFPKHVTFGKGANAQRFVEADICYIINAGKHCLVKLKDEKKEDEMHIVYYYSLNEAMEELNSRKFIAISRYAIVNIDYIVKPETLRNDLITMSDEKEFELTRYFKKRVLDHLSEVMNLPHSCLARHRCVVRDKKDAVRAKRKKSH